MLGNDYQTINKLARGATISPLGSATAGNATNALACSHDAPYPQRLLSVSLTYHAPAAAPVVADITGTVTLGSGTPIAFTIAAAAASGSSVLVTVNADWSAGQPLVVVITGAATNPAGSVVGATATIIPA